MVDALRRTLQARLGVDVALIETHISFVLVCGTAAYKFKKVLRTPYLDQSTLAQREHACREELRLNRRLAPDLYEAVVPVTGTATAPELGGKGRPIDMAVQMQAFAQDGLWDGLAARGQLGAGHVDDLVRLLGRFHASAAVADRTGILGSPARVRAPFVQSLDELEGLTRTTDAAAALGPLRAWEAAAFERLRPAMARRLAQGRVRECHGDLHLGNVTVIEGHSTVFDGIEFSEELRWIDVMSEVAFMAMDLHAHGLAGLAHRFVNAYLELTGDYDGVPVLNYYLVYRAVVRAKVQALRVAQLAAAPDAAPAAAAPEAVTRYLDLALRFSAREDARAVLMLTHGLSGSGKSTQTEALVEAIGAIRIRSDVERKRLAGLQALQRHGAKRSGALYDPGMTSATYAQLARLATPVLQSRFHAILDATFLQRAQRDAARRCAARLGVTCIVLDFDADTDVLRRRLRDRAAAGSDASDADEAVLASQIRTAEPLQADEGTLVFHCRPKASSLDPAAPVDWAPVLQWLQA
jgi:aminoglycoside phosphotransferase family enzyme/predicted kinase